MAGIIYQCVLYGGNTSFSVGNLCIFIILMFFEGRIEEYCYRGMFAEALLMRYRESSKGILGAIVMNGIVSGCISMAVYVFLYKFTFNPFILISLVISECVFAFLYYKNANINTNSVFRFLYNLMILLPFAIFRASFKNTEEGLLIYAMMWFYVCLLAYVNYFKQIFVKISDFQSERVIKFYALYGIMYHKSKSNKTNYGFKHFLDKWNTCSEDEHPSIFMYALYTVLFSGIITTIYYLINIKLHIGEIDIIRNSGLDLLMAQLSTTFLIVSFLSFLTAKDDYILWQDAMSLKFIYPKYSNFVAFSVYAFASFVFTAFFYIQKTDVLVITFFIIGFAILAMLTFKMIIVFFSRRRLLVELELMFSNSLKEEKDEILSRLYQNTVLVVNENNCAKIEENFYFLLRLYFVYKRQQMSLKHSLHKTDDEHEEILLDLVPDEYRHLKLLLFLEKDMFSEEILENNSHLINTYTENDLKNLLERIESELTCFVSLLLEQNPIMLTNMLGEYAGKILEIEGVRTEIKKFISNSLQTSSNSLALQKLFKSVLFKNLSVLSVSANEFPYMKIEENADDRKNETKRMYDSNKNFYDKISAIYRYIKDNYPEKYKLCYDGMMGELQNSYNIMEEFCNELAYVEKCDDKLVAEDYRVWKIFLTIQKNRFEKNLIIDREKQFGNNV